MPPKFVEHSLPGKKSMPTILFCRLSIPRSRCSRLVEAGKLESGL